MVFPRRLRSATAMCLAGLLGVLTSGLPSHSHVDPSPHADFHQVIQGDHHTHGTLLVEQDVRIQTTAPALAVPAVIVTGVVPPAIETLAEPGSDSSLRPRERAPPPGAPRAPPQPA